MSLAASLSDRVIRVFVSSTFRDMQAERDELVLKIFPQLRRLCEERGVTWGEIDLRWGITEEQSQRGEVLPICLEEIRRCRPYFIGLLGERYGWIPDAIPAQIFEDEPWIREYTDGTDKKSVTELEILHGVLRNPEMADHSFFYFRDPTYIDRLPEDQKREDFITEDEQSLQKLNRLKDDIRQQHREGKLKYEPRENYQNEKSLGERVLADFTALIDTLYPPGQEPSPLERERMDHDAFARSRAGVYIGRQEYFDQLDAHIASDAGPLVVLGESGSGKSALLANWALRYREQHPDHFLLLHFIGASPDSANAIGLLRRIMLELKEHFNLPDDVPAQADKIRDEFPNWLTNVATKGPIVLVLDALNQLEDVDAAPDLGWLPRVFPKNCHVIVSTLPGRSLTAIEQRGWHQSTPFLWIHPLNDPERRDLIQRFLKQYTKNLDKAPTDLLVRAAQTANPLYLRVLLNEIRVFGIFEELGDRIDWYLEAQNPYELYHKVIIRWEHTYEDESDLVGDTLSLLWAARRGLSEAELLESLGENGRPLPRADWSPLFLAMSDALVCRNGLLTFAHDFLRHAARDAYLPTGHHQQESHLKVAAYFERQPEWRQRKLDEVPWHLASACRWNELRVVLTEMPCFLGLVRRNSYELLHYWLQLAPRYEPGRSYRFAFSQWSQQIDRNDLELAFEIPNRLATFIQLAGTNDLAAEYFFRFILDFSERVCGKDHVNTASYLINLAQLLYRTNRMKEAEPLYRRALDIFEHSPDAPQSHIASALDSLSQLLEATNRPEEADSLARRALTILEKEFGDSDPRVAVQRVNVGVIASNRSDGNAESEQLIRSAVEIERRNFGPDHPITSTSNASLAAVMMKSGRTDEAESLLRRVIDSLEKSLGSSHPDVAVLLNNLAVCLMKKGNGAGEAEQLSRRALEIDTKAYGESHPAVARDLATLGMTLERMDRRQESEANLRRALEIFLYCSKSQEYQHPDLSNVLQVYIATLFRMGFSELEIKARIDEIGPASVK